MSNEEHHHLEMENSQYQNQGYLVYHTRGVQILMQLVKYIAFNYDLHETGTYIVKVVV